MSYNFYCKILLLQNTFISKDWPNFKQIHTFKTKITIILITGIPSYLTKCKSIYIEKTNIARSQVSNNLIAPFIDHLWACLTSALQKPIVDMRDILCTTNSTHLQRLFVTTTTINICSKQIIIVFPMQCLYLPYLTRDTNREILFSRILQVGSARLRSARLGSENLAYYL